MAGLKQISSSIRKELLNKNLKFSDTVLEHGLEPLTQSLGNDASIQSQMPSVSQSNDLEDVGQEERQEDVSVNPYGPNGDYRRVDITTKNVGDIGTFNNPNSKSPYSNSTLEEGKTLNSISQSDRSRMIGINPYQPDELQKRSVTTKNMSQIGNVSNEKRGDKYSGPDIDVRAGILSREITSGIVEDDTEIGQLGDDYRTFHLMENFQNNLASETTGRINTNPLSLLQGNDFIRANYSITVPKGTLGSLADFTTRVAGVQVPVSTLSSSASIFSKENPINNIDRGNNMILNSGEGQVLSLFQNLSQNKYAPSFEDERTKQGLKQSDKGINGDLYAFEGRQGRIQDFLHGEENNPVSRSNYDERLNNEFPGLEDKKRRINYSNPDAQENGESKFIWADDNINKKGKEVRGLSVGSQDPYPSFSNEKSLLYKTQEIFKTNRMKVMLTGEGKQLQNDDNEITTPQTIQGTSYLSKGSAVKSKEAINEDVDSADKVFCRTWTTFNRYDQVQDLQKNSGLKNVGGKRQFLDKSVLDDNGFAKVSPYKGDGPEDIKKYMLSIENLAWSDNLNLLPEYEKGSGDPYTGTKGRIMWFPPYDVAITDNSVVNWDSTEFIGRGEPVYTYNNTERTMTLQFKVIIDYPSYLEETKGNVSDDELISYASGCLGLEDLPVTTSMLSDSEKAKKKVNEAQKEDVVEDDKEPDLDKFAFNVYFANDQEDFPPLFYENGKFDKEKAGGIGRYTQDGKNVSNNKDVSQNFTDFGLNEEWFDISQNKLEELKTYLGVGDRSGECEDCNVVINGYASSQGNDVAGPEANRSLANDRAITLKDWFVNTVGVNEEDILYENSDEGVQHEIIGVTSPFPDSREVKQARKAEVTYKYNPKNNEKNEEATKEKETPTEEQTNSSSQLNQPIKSRFRKEWQYFEKLAEQDEFVYDKIRDKIKHFHPSFHSTTPEGFNSRLNFLKQCTRQGQTQESSRPSNLAFGRPPVCILRVGDFYHTKIVIDNVQLSFEPLVWDLNPEGVGVQPMIATVDMSFKAIGGSSLEGPVNLLQNAVSFNFFANTEVYDPRSDNIETNNDPNKTADYIRGSSAFNDVEDGQDESEQDGVGNNKEVPDDQSAKAEKQNSGDVESGSEADERNEIEKLINDNSNVEFTRIQGSIESPAGSSIEIVDGKIEVYLNQSRNTFTFDDSYTVEVNMIPTEDSAPKKIGAIDVPKGSLSSVLSKKFEVEQLVLFTEITIELKITEEGISNKKYIQVD